MTNKREVYRMYSSRTRALGSLILILLLLLVGCQSPLSKPSPTTTPAPGSQPSSTTQPPKTSQTKDALSFMRNELLSGKEISFPAASAGRVAVLLFFSTG